VPVEVLIETVYEPAVKLMSESVTERLPILFIDL